MERQDSACIFNIQKFSIHDGPGIRTAVFFKGCPLRCRWCSNPESQAMGVQPGRGAGLRGEWRPLEDLLSACLDDREFYLESGGGVTLSGGEALAQPEAAHRLLQALHREGVHTALETTGQAAGDVFRRVAACADLLLYDLKHHDGERHRQGTGVDNALILRNLRVAVAAGWEILVRIPVIPGYNDSLADACAFARLVGEIGLSRVQLLPFHQFGQNKYALLGMPYSLGEQGALHPEDLADYAAVFTDAGLTCLL